MNIAAVILAAGASRRLGRPKQTVVIGGETLLHRAARIAREAELTPVFAVVADPSLEEDLQSVGATVLLNPGASEGIASSIRIGVTAAKTHAVSGAILMTCDQVAVTASHLRALCELPHLPAGSAYAGAIGIPAYFPASSFADLLQLQGDQGARHLLRGARSIATEALTLDIDTEEDLRYVRELLEKE